jgi:uncharacterized protein YukE
MAPRPNTAHLQVAAPVERARSLTPPAQRAMAVQMQKRLENLPEHLRDLTVEELAYVTAAVSEETAGKLDAVLVDLRGIKVDTAATRRTTKETQQTQHHHGRALALFGRVLRALRTAVRRQGDRIEEFGDEQADLASHVVTLEIAVGQPPDPEELKKALAAGKQLEPEQAKALKLGTGLYRESAETRIEVAALGKKLAIGLAVGAGLGQALPHIITALLK